MGKRERLSDLYALVPEVNCKGLCQAFCGPVMMSDTEHDRLVNLGHDIPRWRPETFADEMQAGRVEMACPVLAADGSCSAYAHRPMVCRLWGAAEELRCPHGCEPTRLLTPQQARDLLLRSVTAGTHG